VEAAPINARPSRESRRAGYGLWVVFFLLLGLVPLIVGYESAMHFGGVAIDGPFQLYNSLRRIQGGFRPGVDFQYFHGLGLPYLHYWLYRLLGGGLRGSELARQGIAAVVFPAVFLVFFRAFAGAWSKAFCLTAAATAASFLLALYAVLFSANGMLGLRSALPTLIPVILYLSPSVRARIVAGGIALGVAMFLSTEQGLAILGAYLVVSTVVLIRRPERTRFLEALATVATAIVMLALCLASVGGLAGMRGAWRYNFRVVPMDQYWYFGAPPNLFVPSWSGGLQMLRAAPPIAAVIVLAIAACALLLRRMWIAADANLERRWFALATLAVYGVLSTTSLLGVFTQAYSQPCWRVVIIIGLLEWSAIAERFDRRSAHRGWLAVPRPLALSAFVLLAWAAMTVRLIPISLTISLPHIVRDHAFGDARFGITDMWPEALPQAQAVIDAHRAPNGELPTLWSTYAGWIEARNGMFHPSADYVIHALGPDRASYFDKFRTTRPALVQTVRPTYTPYETWIENNDWPLYDELLANYQVASLTPWSIFWERRASPVSEARTIGVMSVPAGATAIRLPSLPSDSTALPRLLVVEVEYEARSALAWIPIIGASPRYLVGIDGALSRMPVSLNPYADRARFPIVVKPGQSPTLRFQAFSLLPGARLTPRTVRISLVPLDGGNQPWFSELLERLRH
jgi:hypothetical protein